MPQNNKGIGIAPKPDDTPENRQALEDVLRERLAIRGEYPDDVITPEGMRVPLPPQFRKPTTVVGTDLANTVERLYKLVPELRGRAKSISPGFTPAFVDILANQAARAKEQSARNSAKELLGLGDHSSILGMTDPVTNELYISPRDSKVDTLGTLAHEFQHLMGGAGHGANTGYDNKMAMEPEAKVTGQLARDYFGLKEKK